MKESGKPQQRTMLKERVRDGVLELLVQERFQPGARFYSERALARHFGVTQLTVRAALDPIEDAGYLERRPRSGTYVRKLPGSVSAGNMVAVVMSTTAHLYAELWNELSKALQAAGYVPLAVPVVSETDPRLIVRQLGQIRKMGCDRLVIVDDTNCWQAPLSQQMGVSRDAPRPWSQIIWLLSRGRLPEHISGNTITVDAEAQLDTVLQHLTAQGHRHIAFATYELAPDQPYPWHQTWLESHYCQAMCRAGLGNMIRVIYQSQVVSERIKQIEKIMAEPDRPTAIIASGDNRLLAIEQALSNLGMEVPRDVALVGNLNTPWAIQREYSSVSCEIGSICRETLDLLRSDCNDKRVMVTPRLVVRRSSGGGRDTERDTPAQGGLP